MDLLALYWCYIGVSELPAVRARWSDDLVTTAGMGVRVCVCVCVCV
jgi:hypothetical protein